MASNHYFTDNRNLPSWRKEHAFVFLGHTYTFVTDLGVFSKEGVDRGTEILLQTLEETDLDGDVLDLGCGYGVVGIVVKTCFPKCNVTASDINPRAVELASINAQKNGVTMRVLQSDGFEAIPETYDTILLNPPIRTGKSVIHPLFEEAYKHLKPKGRLRIVIRKQQGASSAKTKLESCFKNCEIIQKHKGYWILESIRLD